MQFSHYKIENNVPFRVDSEKLERELYRVIENFTKRVKSTIQRYFLTITLCWIVLGLFAFLLISSLTFWINPILTAFSLGLFVLGLFAYYVFHRFLIIHKPQKYRMMCEEFGKLCHEAIPYPSGTPQHHSTMALAYALCADYLNGKEYSYYSHRWFSRYLSSPLEILSCFLFWKEMYVLREILLLASVKEYLDLVKSDPVNLTYHSQLANGYVLLSRLYKDPRSEETNEELRWIPKKRYDAIVAEKYRHTAERAIEEFKIISSYAPDDPWVHAQLALSYRDLALPFEEIHACEALLRLCPSDRDTLHRLGTLYFQLGANAKGLEVYKQLCHIDCGLAALLIAQYGCAPSLQTDY